MANKAEIKKWLKADRGWRTNDQLADEHAAKTRRGRVERSFAQKALYRIFSRNNFDQVYPFEQYVPHGPQYVPDIRGFKQDAPLEAKVFYSAHRLQNVSEHGRNMLDEDAMNECFPNFCNVFLEYPAGVEHRTLAAKVLRQRHHNEERGLQWPSPAERLAVRLEHTKPQQFSWSQWVEYWRNCN